MALVRRLLCRLFGHKWDLPDGLASTYRICSRCNLKDLLGPTIPEIWADDILRLGIYPGSFFLGGSPRWEESEE